jgi:hypothetical protein
MPIDNSIFLVESALPTTRNSSYPHVAIQANPCKHAALDATGRRSAQSGLIAQLR